MSRGARHHRNLEAVHDGLLPRDERDRRDGQRSGRTGADHPKGIDGALEWGAGGAEHYRRAGHGIAGGIDELCTELERVAGDDGLIRWRDDEAGAGRSSVLRTGSRSAEGGNDESYGKDTHGRLLVWDAVVNVLRCEPDVNSDNVARAGQFQQPGVSREQ
ncbi:MAG: hypothetical protein ABIR79_19425 [Candidatus Binatia bacterium]